MFTTRSCNSVLGSGWRACCHVKFLLFRDRCESHVFSALTSCWNKHGFWAAFTWCLKSHHFHLKATLILLSLDAELLSFACTVNFFNCEKWVQAACCPGQCLLLSAAIPGPGGHPALGPESVKLGVFSLVSLDLETFKSHSDDAKPKTVTSLYGSTYTETPLPIDLANELGRRDRGRRARNSISFAGQMSSGGRAYELPQIVDEISKRAKNWPGSAEIQMSLQGRRFPFRQGVCTGFKYL